MLRVFVDHLLPVFLAAGAGWLLAGNSGIDARPLSRVAFSVLAPCLVFRAVVESGLPWSSMLRLGSFAILVLLASSLTAGSIAQLLGLRRSLVHAVALVVLLPNAGNFGLAVNRFAFGEEGLARASVVFAASSILTFTIGVLVASLGRTDPRQAVRALLRVPALWALAAAFLVLATGWSLPSPAQRTVDLLSAACIPIFLLVLGIQLRRSGVVGPPLPVAIAVLGRLGGAAALAWFLAPAFGLGEVSRQAAVLQAAMPSAVITIVLATEYELEPEFVTSVVVVTTLLSPLTLTPLLILLGAS